MHLTPFIVAWGILAAVVLFLAIYRRHVAGSTDEFVHLADGEAPAISQQINTVKRLEVIDRWGKILTVITLITGLALAGLFLYQVWQQASALPQ